VKTKSLIIVLVSLIACTGAGSVGPSTEVSLDGLRTFSDIAGSVKTVNKSPRPYAVTIHPDGHLLILEHGPIAVVKIHPITGKRVVLSDFTHGAGPLPDNLWGIAELGDGRIVSGTQGNLSIPRSIIVIDPITGNRNILSAATRDGEYGKGPGFSIPNNVVVQPNGRLALTDSGFATNAVIEVDPATGDRRIISDATHGTGPELKGPVGITVARDGFLFVVDAGLKTIVKVDPNTGDRAILSDTTHGTGTPFDVPTALALLLEQQLAVADKGLKAILVVDLKIGNRTILSDAAHGQGPEIHSSTSVAYHPHGYLVALDPFFKTVFRIDVTTGNRTIIFKY